MYKNEFHDVIAWVDGSADNDDDNPKSGCSVWLGENWYTSQRSPFTGIPEIAEIVTEVKRRHAEKARLAGTQSQGSPNSWLLLFGS